MCPVCASKCVFLKSASCAYTRVLCISCVCEKVCDFRIHTLHKQVCPMYPVCARKYNAPPIYHGIFSPDNSLKTPIARPLGRGMVVFREFIVWPKFYIRIYCAVCSTVLYCTAIYRKSIICVNAKYRESIICVNRPIWTSIHTHINVNGYIDIHAYLYIYMHPMYMYIVLPIIVIIQTHMYTHPHPHK